MHDELTSVLLVGLGSIGSRHARLLSERDDVDLRLCDAATDRLQQVEQMLRRPASGRFTQLAQALADKPHLVFICTPNHLHVPLALLALKAGADLMVEKPMADRRVDAETLVKATREANQFVHVGYQLRFEPGLQHIQQMVRDGVIGTPVAARAMVGSYITLLNAVSPERVNTPYSLLVDYSHEFDFIRWIFGDVREVFTVTASLGNMAMRPPQNVIASTLILSSGAVVSVHMDYVQFPQRRTFEVIGDRGIASYDFMTGEFRHYPHGKEHQYETIPFGPLASRVDDLYRQQIDSILSRRRQRLSPVVDVRDGLAALRIADAGIRSALSGRLEKVETASEVATVA